MVYYDLDFDIVSIILFLIVIVSYLQKKHINREQHLLFFAMTLTAIATPIVEIPASLLIDFHGSWISVMLTNTLYYFFKQVTIFIFLMYVFSHIDMKKSVHPVRNLFAAIPFALTLILIFSNPWTGKLFTYDGEFHSGDFRVFTFYVNYFYLFWALAFICRHKSYYNKSLRILVNGITIISLLLITFQYLYPNILVHNFNISICMLVYIINIERYGMVIDYVTGMGGAEQLTMICEKLFKRKKSFYSMLIKLADADALTSKYGLENIATAIQCYEKILLAYVKKGFAFKFSNTCAILIFDKNADVESIAREIYSSLTAPIVVNSIEIVCGFNISIVSYPQNIPDGESLLASIQYFKANNQLPLGIIPPEDLKISNKIREQMVEQAIADGLKNNNFEIRYQPICTADDQKFITAEALLRLKDPVLGQISPDEFIVVSEKNGSIIEIGKFVLETVCKFISEHNMEELGLNYIEVNLSTVQCIQSRFIDMIDEITSKYKVESKYLCFEITETGATTAPEILSQNLKKLNERGYILALDDFGTGYGNLQRMITSDFKIIKFDKMLTQHLSSGDELRKVFRTLHTMIVSMGSKVVTEGVETKEQFEFIKSTGPSYIQGYYFSKPLSETEFCSFLEDNQKK